MRHKVCVREEMSDKSGSEGFDAVEICGAYEWRVGD